MPGVCRFLILTENSRYYHKLVAFFTFEIQMDAPRQGATKEDEILQALAKK